MSARTRLAAIVLFSFAVSGCGTTVPQLPEVWDLAGNDDATQQLVMQTKRAIYCELRSAVQKTRSKLSYRYFDKNGKLVSTETLPDGWGVQMTLKFTVQEGSTLGPGASYVWPLAKAGETFSLGAGGRLAADATRIDTYQTFYTIGDLYTVLSDKQVCNNPEQQSVSKSSTSSPFVLLSDLGIKDWLPAATESSSYLRSSRKDADSGVGPALGSAGAFSSDSFSYHIKFVIESSASISPVWKLTRLSTASSPLFDMDRVRTHELILTIGPGDYVQTRTAAGTVTKRVAGPSKASASSHLAQEIGSAVANAIRPAQR